MGTAGSTGPVVLLGALGMALAMGMGGFFYTPALPLMVAALHWGPAPGTRIATMNYVGSSVVARVGRARSIRLSHRSDRPHPPGC